VQKTLAICDYGYVLSKGRVVAQGTATEIRDAKEVQEAYFGLGSVLAAQGQA
jgi:branched-chain amino acid transport system ATP-binding protein